MLCRNWKTGNCQFVLNGIYPRKSFNAKLHEKSTLQENINIASNDITKLTV